MKNILGIITGMILVTTLGAAVGDIVQFINQAEATTKLIDTSTGEARAGTVGETAPDRKAPPAITGENVYVAWWTNNTANNNNEVMFRASTDGGVSFGDKINLSNTTDSDSTRVEIDSDVDSVIVTWWETNQTSDVPVMRVSTDNGATFGPLSLLATNGTIGTEEGEE